MTQIEIICGFLESGKTTLIQNILEQEYMQQYRRIVIIQCEEGLTEFRAASMASKDVVLAQIEHPEKIRKGLFTKMKEELDPDLILIEYNGTWPIEQLLRVRLPSDYRIDRILFCAEASTFPMYIKNTGNMMLNQLGNADAVFLNRCSADTDTLKATVRSCNRTAKICFTDESVEHCTASILKPEEIQRAAGTLKRNRIGIARGLITLYLISIHFFLNAPPIVKSINMSFIGILMQAVPFLLIGALVSGLLQVFVSDETLVRMYTGHKWLGYPLAAVSGLFFPICDCGIIPITSRLTQKGVPLSKAMVFMLAAPSVNPVTIISTLYAFPGQPQYALYRVLLGSVIALLAGFILNVSHIRSEDVFLTFSAACSCSAVTANVQGSGKAAKFESVILIAGQEFFSMGKYIVIGAFVCSVLQQTIPVSSFRSTGSRIILPLILMLLAAFFMSVCSTSNAFIGRSFLNIFPITAVMGFIVMGPMLDLSNLLMLSSNFKKIFIVRLACTLLTIAFPVFLLFSVFSAGGKL
ncbi:permease [Caproiciproducens faecalis]|uniref:Permease n=1 Tax=Caproiciproducens faecalis TaxID=2820301 RepID=A0ABS7DLX8_9FIRM|nr:permease [Caproiciproducens faecalis]MBW7572114.1 permease [Caproiciproducens faecalis]